ncbi:MAG: RNA polymerase sporulation sigma factor SigH [Actinomycetota bacterium]|nr:RNA polymerase sporulation sigma factor SigH [Actinomycetota bacterium]
MGFEAKTDLAPVVEGAGDYSEESLRPSAGEDSLKKSNFSAACNKETQMVLSAQAGDEIAIEEIIDKYRLFVKSKARSYFLIGADKEDLIQEGMIGLYKAIRDFSDEKRASFRAFADTCITRQMITAIKTATRQKHIPLNSYVSLNRSLSFSDDPDRTLEDVVLASNSLDPVDMVINCENMTSIQKSFSEVLSEYESDVVRLYIEGRPYQEIADVLNRHVKSVDNALQRVKRKVELYLKNQFVH